jgi:hypothetical protein
MNKNNEHWIPPPDLEKLLLEAEELGIRKEVLDLSIEINNSYTALTHYECIELALEHCKQVYKF